MARRLSFPPQGTADRPANSALDEPEARDLPSLGPPVVGRDVELETISAFLTEGDDALVLSGAPGIGKTVLWERALEEAAARGQRVLTHRAVETEAGLAFAGLANLLSPAIDDVMPALAPPRRRALAVAMRLEDPGDSTADATALGLAVVDALQTLAEARPVVVAVDDLQWLDPATAGVLAPALRRLGGAPVTTVATLLTLPRVRAPFDLTRTFPRLEHLALGPLGLAAIHRLLTDCLGLRLSRPELTRLLEASGGNPFLTLEIGRELARPGGAIGVPASLRGALAAQLAGLPPSTIDVLLVTSASARPTVELVLAACEQPRDAALAALARAAHEGIVTLEQERVGFTDPLLAAVCHEEALPWKRRALHARLATLVEQPEERARHLALAADGTDADVAAELDAAAGHAAARGRTAAAAELSDLAAHHTPPERTDERRRRLWTAAELHRLAGDLGKATETFAALAEELPPGPERADVLHARARVGRDDVPTRVRLAEEALREAGDDDARRAQILGFLAISRWLLGSVPTALREARTGLAHAQRIGVSRISAMAIARVGLLETWAADVTPGLLERGAEMEAGLAESLPIIESPTFMLAVKLSENDGLDRARSMLETGLRLAQERGDEHARQWTILQLLTLEGYSGHLQHALHLAAEARAIAEQTHDAQYRGMVERFAAPIEADVGLVEEARRSAEEGLRHARSVSDEMFTVGNLAALGHIELVLGDMRAAAGCLRELPGRIARTGHLSAYANCSADAIEALIGVGELDRARAYLDDVLEIAHRLNRAMRVGAWRSAGLVAVAEGDRMRALDAFGRSLASDDDPPLYPFERARTLLALGGVQRQALHRRAARETLEQASTVFDELGARPWACKARDELARIGGRQPGSSQLTGAEQRVAFLAAEGRQNKEIAAELFLSTGTVERYLTNAYRKLGVRSRTELARLFSEGELKP